MSAFEFKIPAAAASVDADKEEEVDDNYNPEEESTATFVPVVHLEKVEVKSMEEDEDIVYKKRAKLYVFGETLLEKGKGVKSWNERGVGDVKILKSRDTAQLRIVMRQEKTLKIISNFILDPRIAIMPNVGSNDKSWVWNCFDFADYELKETTFAIRFGDAENALEFKNAFQAGQKEMEALIKGADAATGVKEADEAADALASLSVKSTEGEEPAAAAVAEVVEEVKVDEKKVEC